MKRVENGELSEQEAKKRLGRVLLSQSIGKTGYFFVWDISKAPSNITLAVHPKIQGQDVASVDFVQTGAALKEGYLEYAWKNPDENTPTKKAMYVTWLKQWNWVIAASSYKSEFSDLIGGEQLQKMFLGIRSGENGYSFIINSKGDLIAHPFVSEGNHIHQKDIYDKPFIKNICTTKKGVIDYWWKNPGENEPRKKQAAYDYIPELDWIVVSTLYYDDVYRSANQALWIVAAFTLLLFLLIIPVTIWISRGVTRPLGLLCEALQQGVSGDYSTRLPAPASNNEIGALVRFFNQFMEELERYDNKLRLEIEGHLQDIEQRKQVEDKLHLNAQLLEQEIGERQQAQQELVLKQRQLELLNRTLEDRIVQAIEELRQKDSILIQQNRLAAMGELLTNIAHQWRQPLNNISAYLQSMQFLHKQNELTAEEMDRDIAEITSILIKLSRTIDDFRNFFRQDDRPLEFSMNELLEKILSILMPTFESHSISVNVTGEKDLKTTGVPAECGQALMNILNNAIDALVRQEMPYRRINIDFSTEAGMSVAKVKDNGGGIATEILPHIFNPYFTTKGPSQGTGLGLYMAKTIIEQNMNGKLTATSTGETAEFRIELPQRFIPLN